MKINQIIKGLRETNESIFRKLYKSECRSKVFGVIRKLNSNMSDIDLQDLYQEAIITLWKKVSQNDCTLTCSITTYLTSIAKNIVKNILRKKSTTPYSDISTDSYNAIEQIVSDDNIEVKIEKDEEKSILRFIVQQLPANCNKLVKKYVFQHKSYKEIVTESKDYKNENSAKTAYHKCSAKIIDFFNKNIKPWMNPKN